MNDEQLDRLGQEIVDRADNYLMYETMAVSPDMKIRALLNGLREIRKTAYELYIELAGNDPWDMPA